ncbi:MAG: hypothetical protein AAF357_19145 [Verrucomicrobiota bacterium]
MLALLSHRQSSRKHGGTSHGATGSHRQLYAMVDELKGGKLQPGSISKYGQDEMAMQARARRVREAVQSNSTMVPIKEQ